MSNLTISIFDNKIFLEIVNEIKLFSKFKIKKDVVFLSKKDFRKYNNLKLGPAQFKAEIIDNSYFNINYNSKFENILVISNLYDINWKIDSDKDLKLIKVNYFFTGVICI